MFGGLGGGSPVAFLQEPDGSVTVSVVKIKHPHRARDQAVSNKIVPPIVGDDNPPSPTPRHYIVCLQISGNHIKNTISAGRKFCNLPYHHHLSLNPEVCWGTTDDFATRFLHFSLFSTALLDLANSRPVHSLVLSSNLFLCLPCLFAPFTVPCKMVLARPHEQET